MAHPNVPEFGKWDKEENIPYTMFFDNARKNRGGKIGNPNDPLEYPELQPNVSPKPRKEQDESYGKGVFKPVAEQRSQGGDGDFWHSPSPGPKNGNELSFGRYGHQSPRPSKPLSGSDQSYERSPVHHMQASYSKPNNQGFEKSPVHPIQQAKHGARGIGSQAMDGRSRDSSHGSNERSRTTQSKHDQGTAVPRFGQWNEKDQSGENFTDIFDKVREEKNSVAGTTPNHPSSSTRSKNSSKANNPKKSCGCLPW